MSTPFRVTRARIIATSILLVLGVISVTYWQVRHAQFVWDDTLCFHDATWLRHGNEWTHVVLRNFCDWTSYFRPLVVVLYVLELRAFDVDPGKMHLVSLALHLLNTVLVGIMATRISTTAVVPRWIWPAATASMLVYGLHPALVEPVVWIGCQFELIVLLFMLMGLLVNDTVRHGATRAVAVAACFLLAAFSKETAVVFPPLLMLFDLYRTQTNHPQQSWRRIAALTWQRQKWTYMAVLLAGIVYLAVRHWALGFTVNPADAQPLHPITRL